MKSYLAADGKCYPKIEEAQAVEVAQILKDQGTLDKPELDNISAFIVSRKEDIVNALTITESSRPGARGKKKPRKSTAAVTPSDAAQQ